MTTTHKPEDLIGRDAVDLQGEKIGSVGQVYVNDVTGRPDWVTVNTGLFGLRETFAPLQGSSFDGENLVLPFEKAVVKGAPDVASANHLDTHETDELYSYYSRFMTAGFDGDWASSPDEESAGVLSGYPSEVLAHGATGAQTSDGDSMTRSEEQLRVSTERVETGRARLRKYVVTEQQTVTVPVSREEVRLVREPVATTTSGTWRTSRSPRLSAKWCCTRSARWWRRRRSPSSRSGWLPTLSPRTGR